MLQRGKGKAAVLNAQTRLPVKERWPGFSIAIKIIFKKGLFLMMRRRVKIILIMTAILACITGQAGAGKNMNRVRAVESYSYLSTYLRIINSN